MSTPDIEVVNNEAEKRFEVNLDGKIAKLQYMRHGGDIYYTHTEVPKEFEGQGVASAMAKSALDFARENGLTVYPTCPYVSSYIRRHKEYQDLVPHTPRADA